MLNRSPAFRRPNSAYMRQWGPLQPGANILHLTNIANNALLNALILWEAGYPSYVAHPDMYDFASQPEWFYFDSDRFDHKELGENFFSNWWRLPPDVRKRPRWFAQGPQHQVLSYLRYQRGGHADQADANWEALEFSRLKAVTEKSTTPQAICWSEEKLRSVMHELQLRDDERDAFIRQRAADSLLEQARDIAVKLNGPAAAAIAPPFVPNYLDAFFPYDSRFAERLREARTSGFNFTSGLEIEAWVQQTKVHKPKDVLDSDWNIYAFTLPWWKAMMKQFDVVVSYGAGPIHSYLCDHHPYAAYEHGTIRSLPFEDTTQGRLLQLSYLAAGATFVTNNDYVSAKRRLEFAPGRLNHMPHVFDERPLLDFSNREGGRKLQRSPVTFFSPARHDWTDRSPNSKCNDLLIDAISLAAKDAAPFQVILVDWGVDVAATKELIEKLGVGKLVRWIAPVPKKELWRLYLRSNAVVDQFGIASMSGVLFEALTFGIRCITKDDGSNEKFFGEAPPLLPAQNAPEIAARIRQVINDPLDDAKIGDAAISWMLRHHSHRAFLDKELQAFREMRSRAKGRLRNALQENLRALAKPLS